MGSGHHGFVCFKKAFLYFILLGEWFIVVVVVVVVVGTSSSSGGSSSSSSGLSLTPLGRWAEEETEDKSKSRFN